MEWIVDYLSPDHHHHTIVSGVFDAKNAEDAKQICSEKMRKMGYFSEQAEWHVLDLVGGKVHQKNYTRPLRGITFRLYLRELNYINCPASYRRLVV